MSEVMMPTVVKPIYLIPLTIIAIIVGSYFKIQDLVTNGVVDLNISMSIWILFVFLGFIFILSMFTLSE